MKLLVTGICAAGAAALYALSPYNAHGRCCSFVQLRAHAVSNYRMLSYNIYDNWNFCTNNGPQKVWIAQNGLIAHNWMQLAQSRGHCVEMIR